MTSAWGQFYLTERCDQMIRESPAAAFSLLQKHLHWNTLVFKASYWDQNNDSVQLIHEKRNHSPIGFCAVGDVHLKAHEVDLSWRHVRPAPGHGHAGDVVGVSVEETLLPVLQVLNDQRAAERVDQVLSVRVGSQPREHVTWNTKACGNISEASGSPYWSWAQVTRFLCVLRYSFNPSDPKWPLRCGMCVYARIKFLLAG